MGFDTPLGRDEDIAGTVQFLCGRGAAYISGAVIPLSGGMQSKAPGTLFNQDL